MRRAGWLRLAAIAGGALCAPIAGTAHAQFVQPELRVDALGPAPHTVGPGAGINVGLGYYVRAGAIVAADFHDSGTTTWDARGDLLARFTLDPFRQNRWGLSIGGGLSIRERSTYLALIVDLEGPEVAGWLPALQVGVSGGMRAGLGLRRAVTGRR